MYHRFVGLAFACSWVFTQATPVAAYGEADSKGRPSAEERALLVLTNQVRQAPHDWPDWDTTLAPGTPLRPLSGHNDLFSSARFHADDMALHNHFAHESADGTSFSTRIQRYFSGASGENIYKSTNLDPYAALTAWMNSTGHRNNILRPEWTWLGTGHTGEAPYHYYVQNFGRTGKREAEVIPAAAAIQQGSGGLRLIANFYDPNGDSPAVVRARVGRRCVELSLVTGEAGNGTYQSDQTTPSSCSAVVFWAQRRSEAGLFRYPTTGAMKSGTGCSRDFDADDNTDDCGEAHGTGPYIDAEEDGGCRCVRGDIPFVNLLSFALLALLLLRSISLRIPSPVQRA